MAGDGIGAGLHAGRRRRGFSHGGQDRLNRLLGLLLHRGQGGVIPRRIVGQTMLFLKLGDAEGVVDLTGLEVAAIVAKQTEAKTTGTLGPKGSLHLDTVPKEILGQLADRLTALDGRGDDGVQGGVEVGGLDLWGGQLGQLHFLALVLLVRDDLEAHFPLQATADLFCGEAVAPAIDPVALKVDGRHRDMEVLLAAVVVFDGVEGAVVVAEAIQGFLDLIDGLLGGHGLPQWMGND